MPIIKWAPSLEPAEEMEKFFWPDWHGRSQSFVPAIDMYEDADNVVVETQLAGIDPDQVQISVDNNCLSIKGESEKQREVDEKNYYRKEIRRGIFYRSIALPAHVLADEARAVAEGGVLKITIPKAPISQARTIKIDSK